MSPGGSVRVAPAMPGGFAEGRLVDVSAGGLRVACRSMRLLEGQSVQIEIRLENPARPEGPPRHVLDGSGRVVWTEMLENVGPQAGIRFDQPVHVRPPFPDVQIF